MARRSITVYPARGPCVVPSRAPPRRGRLAVGRNLCRADAPMRRTDHGAAGRASTGPGPRPGVGRQAMVAWAVRRGHDISALCVFERSHLSCACKLRNVRVQTLVLS